MAHPTIRQSAACNPLHSGNRLRLQSRYRPHRGRELDARSEWPAQPQNRPSALQRIHGDIGVCSCDSSATCGEEVVELDAPADDCHLLVQSRKVPAMSHHRRTQRRGSASRISSCGAQMLCGVLLHAHEKVESLARYRPTNDFCTSDCNVSIGNAAFSQSDKSSTASTDSSVNPPSNTDS